MDKIEQRISERVFRLRKKMMVMPSLCVERGYLVTRSYKETEGEPPLIRRAKALEKILREMTIGIEEDEIIVGRATTKTRGGVLLPEVRSDTLLEEMEIISKTDWSRYSPLSEEEKIKMMEFIPYWKGKSLYDKFMALLPEYVRTLKNEISIGVAHCDNSFHHGHTCFDCELVINYGLNGIKQRIDEEVDKLNLAEVKDFEKYQFFRAVNITLEAAIVFAKRYAELAQILADHEKDIQRKLELEKIVEICSWVPANPARSFHEALQSLWFTYLVIMFEGWGPAIGFGRPDQYLYSYYMKDIENKVITKQEARELIALFYIKLNEILVLQSGDTKKSVAGFPLIANITLGGVTRDGKDAVNELSYLFLEAEKTVGLTGEDIVIRVNKVNPDTFLMEACEVAKLLKGKLKFVSDQTAIMQLLSDGKPIEYARDYVVSGCVNLTVPGRSHDLTGGMFNLPLMLELALNNGISRLTGGQIGPKTGDPKKFKSYKELWEAYKKQVETFITYVLLYRDVDKKVYAEFAPYPFLSALFEGCIEKGKDITNGGTYPYMTRSISLAGVPNVGDSLAAVKKAVFEDKKITMERLINALDKNFKGEDEILHILRNCPKFGNDDDYVDLIVNEVVVHANEQIVKYQSFAGAKSTVSCQVSAANLMMGYKVGALPDTRKAGEPLSEGGISPYQGRNTRGPTATMKSVAKLDHLKLTNGSVLNMRFNPDLFRDESKMRKFVSLIRTFCETGGYLVQFNILSTDTLREAQTHPENYRDLLVRVATYSSYFVELSKEYQDDIIARIEFQEV